MPVEIQSAERDDRTYGQKGVTSKSREIEGDNSSEAHTFQVPLLLAK